MRRSARPTQGCRFPRVPEPLTRTCSTRDSAIQPHLNLADRYPRISKHTIRTDLPFPPNHKPTPRRAPAAALTQPHTPHSSAIHIHLPTQAPGLLHGEPIAAISARPAALWAPRTCRVRDRAARVECRALARQNGNPIQDTPSSRMPYKRAAAFTGGAPKVSPKPASARSLDGVVRSNDMRA